MIDFLPSQDSEPVNDFSVAQRGALKLALLYAFFSAIYIATSDQAVSILFQDPKTIALVSTAKGWGFIGVTAVLLYIFIRRQIDQVVEVAQREQEIKKDRIRALLLLESIASNSTDAIFAKDLKGRYLLFNREAARVTGKLQEAVVGHDDTALFPPDQAAEVMSNDRHVMTEDRTITFLEIINTTDGELSYLATKGPLHGPEGEVVGMFGISRDVTEHQRHEKLMREKEEQLERVGNMANIGGWSFDAETLDGSWADQIARIYELDATDQSSVELGLSFFHGEWRKAIESAFQEAINHGTPYDLELEIITAKGNRKWVRTMGLPVMSGTKVTKVHGCMQDISARKIAEEALQEREESYRALIEQSPAIIYRASVDNESKTIYISPRISELGYSQQEWTDTLGLWRQLIHPDDADRVIGELEKAHSSGAAFSSEYRLKANDGQWRHFHDEALVIHDASGKPLYLQGMMLDMTQHKKAEETIHSLAFYNVLTGLPNRRLLLDRLQQSLLSSVRSQHQGAILAINLDDFKSLNDTKGHEVGDLLLLEIAKRIQACIHTGDTLAHLGSDEFVVVLDALSLESDQAAMQAEGVAERIHNAIKIPFNLNGYDYYCKACIGISLFQNQETQMENLLKRADSAMFQAKQTGRDKIHFFDSNMQAALEARVLLESWLRMAIPDQLRLYYQMQVDGSGKVFGAEALIRWLHPEKGMISPVDFIPLAEDTGLILPIGRWVLETACNQLKAWEGSKFTRHLLLAVNVSAKQFHQAEFVKEVLDVLMQTGADPSKLKLELTESLLVENVDKVIDKMAALRAEGVRFSLDDFGTGFSSLAYLKRLPLDQLKIDQSFVRDLLTDPNDAAIVRTVIALGQSLGLAVIAEGVEVEAQREFLAIHGCSNFQGYLFSKPLPLEEFESLIRRG